MELLLKRGANVNARNIIHSTLLHEAVECGNTDTTKTLLNSGADVNALGYFGDSPVLEGLQDEDIDLMEFPVNSTVGATAWHNQYSMLPFRASQRIIYATVQLLLEHGADVNSRGWRHKTPLHLASLGGSLDVSRLLIEHGADINAQDDEFKTPFSIAVANGHRKLAMFLSNGRVQEDDVRPPFHWYPS
ncbi:ankyrin repeat-containing domain protein [Russula ochroleuca]|uniref:Ankyrin repeat-containing domain protein n=1 Tax=Russula ochroleuca TaxID=152965 RepID=A0A9P5MU67_9AGAM|nr:ankyrin repeat-containing domain protein [Russula ochroleuca]